MNVDQCLSRSLLLFPQLLVITGCLGHEGFGKSIGRSYIVEESSPLLAHHLPSMACHWGPFIVGFLRAHLTHMFAQLSI